MKEISILNAFSRETVGSNSSKKVRGDNKIPAIIYGDGKNPEPIDYNNIPGCTYCSPEVASVGFTEKTAKEKGYELSEKLDDLYLYCIKKCARAKKLNDADTLVHVQAVIAEVASAWAHLPMIKEVA